MQFMKVSNLILFDYFEYFLYKWSTRLQSTHNHMVRGAASVGFYTILPGATRSQCRINWILLFLSSIASLIHVKVWVISSAGTTDRRAEQAVQYSYTIGETGQFAKWIIGPSRGITEKWFTVYFTTLLWWSSGAHFYYRGTHKTVK